MRHPFSAIRQSKVSEDIVEQIKTLIRDGRLKPGEKLPSERQLAMALEVGRSSLREAINSLSMMGLVEVRQRKGIFVGTVSTPLVTDPLRQLMADDQKTFANLYDIRIDLEVASAMAAAEKRTDEQLGIIGASLKKMKNKRGESVYGTENDLRFHMTIAEATDNFIRVHIIKEIFGLASDHIHSALKKLAARQDNINTIHQQHTAIYEAIADRDRAGAGSAMKAHLVWVKSQLNTLIQ